MEFTQIWTARKASLRRSICGVRVRVTRPNSDEIGRLNLAQLKLILSFDAPDKHGVSDDCHTYLVPLKIDRIITVSDVGE